MRTEKSRKLKLCFSREFKALECVKNIGNSVASFACDLKENTFGVLDKPIGHKYACLERLKSFINILFEYVILSVSKFLAMFKIL